MTKGRYQFLLNSSPVIIYSLEASPGLKVKSISKNLKNILGYDTSVFFDIPGFFSENVHPEDREKLYDFETIFFVKEKKSYEYRFRDIEGNYHWMMDEINPIFDEDGNPLEAIGSWQDITRRKNTEIELNRYREKLEEMVKERTHELEESRESFRALAENTSDTISRFDMSCKYIYANRSVQNYYNLTEDKIIGRTYNDLPMKKEVREIRFNALKEVLCSGHIMDLIVELDDGIWFDFIIIPEFDINGRVKSVVTSGRNITETKKMQLALELSLKKEHELNEMKNRFISMVSHEFRTPLTSIVASADFWEMGGDSFSSAKKAKHFNRVRRNIDSMIGMLNEVLFLNKMESTDPKINFEKINLSEFCTELIKEAELLHPNIRCKTKFNLSEKFYFIDTVLTQKIIGNLIDNAFKYNSEKGSVVFTLSSLEDRLIFDIKDTGIGIPYKEHKSIFDPFVRLSNVKNIKGTGLGLNIVKKSVEQLGGDITFTSIEGSGTTFTVTLPIHKERKVGFV